MPDAPDIDRQEVENAFSRLWWSAVLESRVDTPRDLEHARELALAFFAAGVEYGRWREDTNGQG